MNVPLACSYEVRYQETILHQHRLLRHGTIQLRFGGDWYDGGQYREIYTHTYTAQTSAIKNAWSDASQAIGTCNANIQVVEGTTIFSESDKQMKLAEMRGVRAFWYYKMMDEWGNIPLVTDYSDKELPTCQSRQGSSTGYDCLCLYQSVNMEQTRWLLLNFHLSMRNCPSSSVPRHSPLPLLCCSNQLHSDKH